MSDTPTDTLIEQKLENSYKIKEPESIDSNGPENISSEDEGSGSKNRSSVNGAEQIPVSVRILDKDYQVSCRVDEKDSLLETAIFLDRKMHEIRDARKVVGSERIAVMAALNLAYDCLFNSTTQVSEAATGELISQSKIKDLNSKVEMALIRFK